MQYFLVLSSFYAVTRLLYFEVYSGLQLHVNIKMQKLYYCILFLDLRLLLARIASRPFSVLGPVDRPPWSLQRPFIGMSLILSHTGGAWQSVPFRVLALHVPRLLLGFFGSSASNTGLPYINPAIKGIFRNKVMN